MGPQDVFIRVAHPGDLDELATMFQSAFINSPAQTFFSGRHSPLTTQPKDKQGRRGQTAFLRFLIRRSWSLNARITVVIVMGEGGKEKIAGSTIWRPPIKQGSLKTPTTLSAVRMGLLWVLWYWGIGMMGRISEMVKASESVLEDEYKSRPLTGSPDDSWYLQLAGVDPLYQRKGYMTMLIQEAFEYAPGAVFTLEATTPGSRDVYRRLGFKVLKEVIVAPGKVDKRGVVAEGDAATGFPIYPMIKV